MHKKSFASDNYSGVHPHIMQALNNANTGHVGAYGSDPYTKKSEETFKQIFGSNVDVYLVFNGTAANVLGLSALLHSHEAIICAATAHISTDECGAPEKYIGCKLLTCPTPDGKLTVDLIKERMIRLDDQHHVQPRVISITQVTEYGTVYTPQEIRAITDYAHAHNLLVHMDGARLANAVASLNVDVQEITTRTGIDLLSFGGTKNGMMYGEAIVFFNAKLSEQFKYVRKQGMQLASKMRFIAAQFDALLSNGLWLANAGHANKMAALLAEKVSDIAQVRITQPVQANGIFALLPPEHIAALQQEFSFYVWDERTLEVRWMTSFDTTAEDIEQFYRALKAIVKD